MRYDVKKKCQTPGPDIILADEPTGNLDSTNTQVVVRLLRHFSTHMDKTILFVTHNRELTKWCDRVLAVKDGRIMEERCGE